VHYEVKTDTYMKHTTEDSIIYFSHAGIFLNRNARSCMFLHVELE